MPEISEAVSQKDDSLRAAALNVSRLPKYQQRPQTQEFEPHGTKRSEAYCHPVLPGTQAEGQDGCSRVPEGPLLESLSCKVHQISGLGLVVW